MRSRLGKLQRGERVTLKVLEPAQRRKKEKKYSVMTQAGPGGIKTEIGYLKLVNSAGPGSDFV